MGDVADVQTITSLSVVVPPSNYVIGNTIDLMQTFYLNVVGYKGG
jgi:hypothetical protein